MKRIPNEKIIGYQVYLKSFKDTNNKGYGTIKGVIDNLWYFKYIGVNLLWLSPFLESPMVDNGYDVSSFYKVNKDYGTIRDIKKLIKKANSMGIMVICDFVLNHTSSEHPFFKKAIKNKKSKYRDYYYFIKVKKDNNDNLLPPTNWNGFFSNSVWTKLAGEDTFYMHIFSDKMPDLNYTNPKVRKEIIKFGKFWAKKGFSGFRVDAVSHLSRAPFIDINRKIESNPDYFLYSNLPMVHEYLKELNKELFSKYNLFTIGEVGGNASIEDAIRYSGKDSKELDLVFNFDHNYCFKKNGEIDLVKLKMIFKKWQDAFKGENMVPLNWLNHDQNRLASRYGASGKYHLESLKSLALMRYLMRGVPFIYQGEELGLKDITFSSILEIDDIAAKNRYNSLIKNEGYSKEKAILDINETTRDQSRTPIPWNDNLYAGFSEQIPWLKISDENKELNVSAQVADKNSLLNFYKRLFEIRNIGSYSKIFQEGDFIFTNLEDKNLFSYKRFLNNKEILVFVNYSNKDYKLKLDIGKYDILLNTRNEIENLKKDVRLSPYQGIVIIEKDE